LEVARGQADALGHTAVQRGGRHVSPRKFGLQLAQAREHHAFGARESVSHIRDVILAFHAAS
jgi:hypothetical protein